MKARLPFGASHALSQKLQGCRRRVTKRRTSSGMALLSSSVQSAMSGLREESTVAPARSKK